METKNVAALVAALALGVVGGAVVGKTDDAVVKPSSVTVQQFALPDGGVRYTARAQGSTQLQALVQPWQVSFHVTDAAQVAAAQLLLAASLDAKDTQEKAAQALAKKQEEERAAARALKLAKEAP